MVDEALEQPAQFAALTGGERLQQSLLCGFHARVEALQRGHARRRELNEVAPAIPLVTDPRDETVALELVENRVQVAAIDPQASSERRLACGALLGERGEHDEMLPARAFLRERVGYEALRAPGHGVGEPAR